MADQLKADGHTVRKINFNGGDAAYWLPRKSILFRKKLKALPEFLESVWQTHGITDQILFGDCRPVHKSAVNRAEDFGIRTHVFEEGYFRPFWITLEREGVNGHSLLPRDPDWFREVGARLSDPANLQFIRSPFIIRAAHDVFYHLAGLCNPLVFPHYQNHAPYSAPVEYAGYIRRFLQLNLRKNQDTQTLSKLLNDKIKYYVLPLQLSSDAQIRSHSLFNNMSEVIEYVMESFAKHAPLTTQLVIKNHPLDAGLVNYSKLIQQLAGQFDLTGRIAYLETCNLNMLLSYAAGTVTVNSTVGGLALELNCPTIALSDPIYNLPGLTFQGGLDAFWMNNAAPEPELYHCFRNAVIHTTQINGNFYCSQGIDLAIKNSIRAIEADKSLLEELL
ncbi:MAG: capsule biosynthesis protein [Methylococcaceae bacterium]